MKTIGKKLTAGVLALTLASAVMAQEPSTSIIPTPFSDLSDIVKEGFNKVLEQMHDNFNAVFNVKNLPIDQMANTAAIFTRMTNLQPLADSQALQLTNTLSQGQMLLTSDEQKTVDCSDGACANFNILTKSGTYDTSQSLQAKSLLQSLNNPKANGFIPIDKKTKEEAAKGNTRAEILVALSKYTNTMQSLPMQIYAQNYTDHVAVDSNSKDSLSSLQQTLNAKFGDQTMTQAIGKTSILGMIVIRLSQMANYLHQIANETETLKQSNLLQAANMQNTLIMIRLLAKVTYGQGGASAANVGNLSKKAQEEQQQQQQQQANKNT